MIISYSDFINKFLWRNNIVKSTLIFSLVMSFSMYAVFAFLFYYLDAKDENIINFTMSLQLLFGGVSQFYSNYFAYYSSVYVAMDIRNVDLNKLLKTIFEKLLVFQVVIYILPAFLFLDRYNIFVIFIELALFNMGICSFLMLFMSVKSDSLITTHYRSMERRNNKSYFSLITFILFPMAAGLIWLDGFLVAEFGSYVGRSLIVVSELIPLVFYPVFISTVSRKFIKLRYKKMTLNLSCI